jgi:hypothetical protein
MTLCSSGDIEDIPFTRWKMTLCKKWKSITADFIYRLSDWATDFAAPLTSSEKNSLLRDRSPLNLFENRSRYHICCLIHSERVPPWLIWRCTINANNLYG